MFDNSPGNEVPFQSTDRLAKKLFFFISGLFLFFIMFASWIPAGNKIFHQGKIRPFFLSLPSFQEIYSLHDLRDITTNVLLYIPLGFFLALAVGYPRPQFVTPWLLTGSMVSFIMETGQGFIGRYPDIIDIFTNTIGFLMGFFMVLGAVRFMGLRPAVIVGIEFNEKEEAKVKAITALRFLYVCIFMVITFLPFDVSVNFQQIYTKLMPAFGQRPKIILDPFYHFKEWSHGSGQLFLDFLGYLPMAILTATLDGFKKRLNVWGPVYLCVILATVSEIGQIFIFSRVTDIFMILLSLLAGVIGWFSVKVWFNLQEMRDQTSFELYSYRWHQLRTAILVYAVLICLSAWSPYQFEHNPNRIAEKIMHEANLVPFKEHFAKRDLQSALDIVKEIGIFIPFGLLVTFYRIKFHPMLLSNKNVSPERGQRTMFMGLNLQSSRLRLMILVARLSFLLACFAEVLQVFCIGRYFDVTDILLGSFGGVLGSILFRLFAKYAR